jgi:hypothetical protein
MQLKRARYRMARPWPPCFAIDRHCSRSRSIGWKLAEQLQKLGLGAYEAERQLVSLLKIDQP